MSYHDILLGLQRSSFGAFLNGIKLRTDDLLKADNRALFHQRAKQKIG